MRGGCFQQNTIQRDVPPVLGATDASAADSDGGEMASVASFTFFDGFMGHQIAAVSVNAARGGVLVWCAAGSGCTVHNGAGVRPQEDLWRAGQPNEPVSLRSDRRSWGPPIFVSVLRGCGETHDSDRLHERAAGQSYSKCGIVADRRASRVGRKASGGRCTLIFIESYVS